MADHDFEDETLREVRAKLPLTDPGHLIAEHASRGEPGQVAATDDPGSTRAEIDRTRARMSRTLDSIESALLRKKEQIQERLDVMAPVRERPLVSVGAVFGGALVLGYLTGGGRDEEPAAPASRRPPLLTGMPLAMDAGLDEGGEDLHAELWETRARRLLRVARAQEDELATLRARLGEGGAPAEGGLRALGSSAAEMRDGLVGSLAAMLTDAFNRLRDGAEHVAEAAADRVDDLKERAKEGIDAVREHAPEVADAVAERASDGLDAVRDRVDSIRG